MCLRVATGTLQESWEDEEEEKKDEEKLPPPPPKPKKKTADKIAEKEVSTPLLHLNGHMVFLS